MDSWLKDRLKDKRAKNRQGKKQQRRESRKKGEGAKKVGWLLRVQAEACTI